MPAWTEPHGITGQRARPHGGRAPPGRRVLAELLGRLGHTVSAFATVRAAINTADRDRFDVLVSDISLAGGSGLDAGLAAHRVRPLTLQALGNAIDAVRLPGPAP